MEEGRSAEGRVHGQEVSYRRKLLTGLGSPKGTGAASSFLAAAVTINAYRALLKSELLLPHENTSLPPTRYGHKEDFQRPLEATG